MGSAKTAFRAVLIALAGAGAAVIAHVAIDVAGDYLLARDAYDGVPHDSRAIFVVAIAAFTLVAGLRVLFDMLDRRCATRTSLLRSVRSALGPPAAFAAQSACVAVATLAGMELLDCAASHAPVDDVGDLFGGSLALGLSIVLSAGVVCGWLLHAAVRFLAKYEPGIVALLVRLVVAESAAPVPVGAARRLRASRTIERGLLLSQRGSKRGPPLASPG